MVLKRLLVKSSGEDESIHILFFCKCYNCVLLLHYDITFCFFLLSPVVYDSSFIFSFNLRCRCYHCGLFFFTLNCKGDSFMNPEKSMCLDNEVCVCLRYWIESTLNVHK